MSTENPRELVAVVEPEPPWSEDDPIKWEDAFYRCPNTGEWVWKYADQRVIAAVKKELGA